jgi:hypothetical protein
MCHFKNCEKFLQIGESLFATLFLFNFQVKVSLGFLKIKLNHFMESAL